MELAAQNPPKRGHFFLSCEVDRALGSDRNSTQQVQKSRFQSNRLEVGWAGLFSGGCLVLSGEGCCIPGGFVTGRRAA